MSLFWKEVPVLAYHKISNHIGWGITNVPVRFFYNQMRFLHKNGFQTIPVSEIPLTNNKNSYSKKIAITFDDGDVSVFENAFPIMKTFGFVGNVFIITDYIGKWATWDANPFGVYAKQMDGQQIITLHKNGWEIGSHTTQHIDLTSLSNEQLIKDLKNSKLDLENIIHEEITSISYPFNRFNKRVLVNALQVGYQKGFILGNSKNPEQDLIKMMIPRLGVYLTSSLKSFKRKIDGKSMEFYRQQIISHFAMGSIIWKRYFDGDF